MENSKELLKVQLKMSSYFSKVDALVEALDDTQKLIYQDVLCRKKEQCINHHKEELDGELLELVARLFR